MTSRPSPQGVMFIMMLPWHFFRLKDILVNVRLFWDLTKTMMLSWYWPPPRGGHHDVISASSLIRYNTFHQNKMTKKFRIYSYETKWTSEAKLDVFYTNFVRWHCCTVDAFVNAACCNATTKKRTISFLFEKFMLLPQMHQPCNNDVMYVNMS